MAVKDADKTESKDQKPEKTEEELKADEAATQLLKELEEESGKADESDEKDESGAEDETGDGKDEDGETEEDESGDEESEAQSDKAQKKGKRGYKRRHSRLIEQRDKERKEKGEVQHRLDSTTEENKLLKLKLQQIEEGTIEKEPNPDDFDLGTDDPAYRKADKDFRAQEYRKIAREEASKAAKHSAQGQTREQAERELQRKQKTHWDNADTLGVDDYDEKEVKATEILGAEMVTNIIDYFPDDSHKLIYHLGTNEDVAEDVADLLESKGAGMVKGVAELGRILERINAKKPKSKATPSPDEDTKGSGPSPQEALQRKLDLLREDAAKTGRKDGMTRIMEFKRKCKERGVTVS